MQHKHTNSLINESSPYLLQHAHNPVNWFAWGPEALQKAVAEDKIVLVSIGYAACHWCHVMERESFENEAVAEKMNQYFINIKIDREERPDLDHIYMDAVQAISGSGGWPLNVFLTPDAKPFYGGTYFPPVNAYNRSSWPEVIDAIAKSWAERKNEITAQAQNLLQHLEKAGNFAQLAVPEANATFTKEQCAQAAANCLLQADGEWGGFGKAPKFPQTFTIQFLLQHYYFTANEPALKQAILSIDKMIQGGIYDHAGGGFARYSTDAEWLAPHFEKMLYDNALLINVLCDAYQITKHKKYQNAITQTIDFLKREMMDAAGGFYAALDADSEGEEGKFYVWDKAEIESVLGIEAPLFCKFYDVTATGNWEGKNILRVLKSADSFAQENGRSEENLVLALQKNLHQLLTYRSKRIRPITDDKILLGWNALLVTALCKASAALQNQEYKSLAVQTFAFLQQQFKADAGGAAMYHTYKNGTARYPAFLDDYACLIQACLHLQELTSEAQYLHTAEELTEFVIENFCDAETGFFYFTHKEQQDVVLRKKELYDGATPSGNSIMAENLFYLSVLLNKPHWQQMAAQNTAALVNAVVKYPTSFAVWASLLQKQTFGTDELVVCGPGFEAKRNELLQHYLPAKILQCAAEESSKYPMLNGKKTNGETLIYPCRQYSCQSPVNTVNELLKVIKQSDKI